MNAKQLIKYLKALPPDTQIEVMHDSTWYDQPSTTYDTVDIEYTVIGTYDNGRRYVRLNSHV
jgi:hypothetical protein